MTWPGLVDCPNSHEFGYGKQVMQVILIFVFLPVVSCLQAESVDVYFGTGGDGAKGIYHARLDAENGQLSPATLAAEVGAPGFLASHPDRTRIYGAAVVDGQAAVVAYGIAEDGELSLLNSEPISEGRAAHIAVHPSGNFLLTAQYSGGSVALFPLAKDGRVLPCGQIHAHEGASGVDPKRQTKSHPHWVGFSPDGRFAFVPDLGLDQIVIYKIQSDMASMKKIGAAEATPGGGPRHMKFSIDGKYIFLIDELSVSLSSFAYDAETGAAELVATTPTLSPAMKAASEVNTGSEVLVHPNGRYVYAANRGHDSVTGFQIDPGTGHLYVVDNEPIRGVWPRNINLDSGGRWLLAAGARSDSVTVFAIDPGTGALTFLEGSTIQVPNPICVLIND